MLVMANGAFKSGSTWLRDTVLRMGDFAAIPRPYRLPENAQWLNPVKLEAFLDEVDCRSVNYISKSHLFGRPYVGMLLSRPGVRVLDISRDIRDTIVSHYHHLVREGRIREGFGPYYWKLGRYKAYQLLLYHASWDTGSPRVYQSSFERLKTDFDAEVRRIADFLGFAVSNERIEEIREETSIDRLRKRRGEDAKGEDQRFYRKGAMGDWQRHFDEPMLRDLEQIQRRGLSLPCLVKYHVLFTARQAVKQFLSHRSRSLSQLLRRY